MMKFRHLILIISISILILTTYTDAFTIGKEIIKTKRDFTKNAPLLSSIIKQKDKETERVIISLEKKPFALNTQIWLKGGKIIHEYGKLKGKVVVEIPKENLERLGDLPYLQDIKEDKKVKALLEDSVYQIKADYAWDNAITGTGIKVCVVDTGIDYNHPDLAGKVIAQYDFYNYDGDAIDDHGHGTHVAGIIASQGPVYRGVSYDVALMAAKVLDYTGNGYASDVVLGINWCVANDADIISLSLGEGSYSGACDGNEMAIAVNNAVDNGIVVVAASGNDGDPVHLVAPACASKAIAVGAVDKLDNIASYSNGGIELDLVAPGGDQLGGKKYPEIVSTFSQEVANNPSYCFYLISDICYDNYLVVEGQRYIKAIGTSMATPHVAGAAALLLEENPDLTPQQVKSTLEQNADDFGAIGWDNIYGWGRINLQRALENIPQKPVNLTVRFHTPETGSSFNINENFTMQANVSCHGGSGCGEVTAYARFCKGDCDDFIDMNLTTELSTDKNPIQVGQLSGQQQEVYTDILYDARTVRDVSEAQYDKYDYPDSSLIGSAIPSEYNTGDLEPQDGVGAIEQNAEALYNFTIPAGVIKRIKIRQENYLVIRWHEIGWKIHTSNATGNNLNLIGTCEPDEGGGGYPPPPDCWYINDSSEVLSDLNPGGLNFIHLESYGMGDGDWLTFNDIEVIIEYEADPNNDNISRYYVKFNISGLDSLLDLDSAFLNLYVSEPSEGCIGEVYFSDSYYQGTGAYTIYNSEIPPYSGLINPLKSFSCEATGIKKINIKPALEEALTNEQDFIAFQIREKYEDDLFKLYGSQGLYPPYITYYTPTGQTAGIAAWNVTGNEIGLYNIRVFANTSTDVRDATDARLIQIISPDMPSINKIECEENNSLWEDCRNITYSDTLSKIKINCTDPQEIPTINISLINIPDNNILFESSLNDGTFIFNTTLLIQDSGEWEINIYCNDSDGNSDDENLIWLVPWGTLSGNILYPTNDIVIPKNNYFDFNVSVDCSGGECYSTNIKATLNEPQEIKYDDGSAEDYGKVGDGGDTGKLAVRFTPPYYSVKLKKVKVYVYDATLYPFILHVWDDDGAGVTPGSDLIIPLEADPSTSLVNYSGVGWFEIDLSSYNLTINSGDFFVGWEQVEAGKVNKVGFDTNSFLNERSYGYLLGDWFNLNFWCDFGFSEYCGDLMIRAIITPQGYEGDLPTILDSAPFYTTDNNPQECENMKPNDNCEKTFKTKAVGNVGNYSRFYSLFTTNYSLDKEGPVNVTITEPLKEYLVSNLSLSQGWNLISFPINLTNNSINYLFNNINFSIFGYKNNSWFTPKEIDNKLGYWININESINLSISGAEIENNTINLTLGWNLIGHPYLTEMDVNSSYLQNYTTLSYNNSWLSYVPNRSTNSLKTMGPGYGYWVNKK